MCFHIKDTCFHRHSFRHFVFFKDFAEIPFLRKQFGMPPNPKVLSLEVKVFNFSQTKEMSTLNAIHVIRYEKCIPSFLFSLSQWNLDD